MLGSVLDDRFELLARIVRGSSCHVYDGWDAELAAPCVVKVLTPSSIADATLATRFEREVRIANAVHHPHAVAVLGQGITPAGAPYFVTERFDGELLSDALLRGPLTLADARRHAFAILSFLQALHGLGFVHRDLKPDNLWLVRSADGITSVRVLDFGIAGYVEGMAQVAADYGLTPPGIVMGTPAYCAPERLRGETVAAASVDLYAAAVVIYMMVTGASPFDGAHGPMVGPAPMSVHFDHVPSALERVLRSALSPMATDRYPSASAFAKAIADAGTG